MIKFFRNIRQKLIHEGKTANPTSAKARAGTYLKYAIGEIVLVVIGILIVDLKNFPSWEGIKGWV